MAYSSQEATQSFPWGTEESGPPRSNTTSAERTPQESAPWRARLLQAGGNMTPPPPVSGVPGVPPYTAGLRLTEGGLHW